MFFILAILLSVSLGRAIIVTLLRHGFNVENIKSNLSLSTGARRLEISMIYCYFGVINLKIPDELRSKRRLFPKRFPQKKRIKMKMVKQEILTSVIKTMCRLMNNSPTIYYLAIDQVGVEK